MLPKKEHLSRTRDIEEALKQKQYVFRSPLLSLTARDNNLCNSRLAVGASKKLGSAVKRNRVRRLIFEAFSRLKGGISKQIDVVIYPRQLAAEAGLEEFTGELRKAFLRHRICDKHV